MDPPIKSEGDGFVSGVTLGLDPRVHLTTAQLPPMKPGWVYMLSNGRGTLYIGVTSDLAGRIWQHREGVAEGFSKRHGLKRLVWFETHDDIAAAIAREKALKRWLRQWKIDLVERGNPGWDDLYETLF